MGVVGSGGNVGAAIFSVFFVQFNYRSAFLMMGLSAVGSSMLCIFMKTEKLAQTYEAVMQEIAQRHQDDDDNDSDSLASPEAVGKSQEAPNGFGEEILQVSHTTM